MQDLLKEILQCTICAERLDHQPRPVLQASPKSKIIIIGQAPGAIVNRTGIPWDDKSGENLRDWMNVDNQTFYDEEQIALIPMGFCYPGKGKSGDLPPRPECAPQWHDQLIEKIEAKLTLLIGQYAQSYYLKGRSKPTLTATVQNYREYLPNFFVLPHPSPRNNIWRAKNPWFDQKIIPQLKKKVKSCLD